MKRKWLVAAPLILAELALCGGIAYAGWIGFGQLRAGRVEWRVFQRDNVSAEADEEQRAVVDGPATLTVENSSGQITVTGGPGDEMIIVAHKKAWGPTQAEAEAALAALKVNVTQNGNDVTVQVERPEKVTIFGDSRADSVDFTITVPKKTAVTGHSNFGDVSLSGTDGNADLQTDFGQIEIENVAAESVKAHSSSGGVSLTEVEAGGNLTLSSDFGSIEFHDGRAASLDARTNSGKVTLESLEVEGAVTAHSDFGDVTLTGVKAASYDVSSNSGKISLAGAGGAIKAHSDFGDVTVTDAMDADLDLQTNSGAISFAGSLGDGPHVVHSDFGDVRLSLPEASALTLDLKTDFGAIDSEFPVTINGGVSSAGKPRLSGTLHGGGATLTASTNSGNIQLEILKP